MKEPFEQYLAENRWLVWEKGWKKEKQNVQETLFTIGNGYLGMRGIYEEIPTGSQPGTYIAGVYDAISSQVTELVNAPNPIDFRINFGGEKLDLTAMDVISHQRALDMSQGLLARKTIYQSAYKHRFNYQSVRFVSMQQKHIGVLRVYFTPMDESVRITVQSAVNENVINKGLVTEGPKKHFHIHEFNKYGSVNYLTVKTFEKNVLISYASHLKIYRNYKNYSIAHRTMHLTVNQGETVVFTKFFSVHTSRHIGTAVLKKRAIETLRKAVRQGFESLLNENSRAWQKKWSGADISIHGNSDIDRGVRFNIYHMMISAQDDKGFSSIGAKTLSGEGYRGHIFWDTEIFMLPFFAYILPQIARSILLYRYFRLDRARRLASDNGCKGAQFPWESADDGTECTPAWHKNYDGRVIPIYTMLREHHISADIAYGAYTYYLITDDSDFIIQYGLEIIIETARFWVSRMQWNPRARKFDIRHVIGPDEFQEDVNNNAYTNTMAQWNIKTALALIKELKKKYGKAVSRLLARLKVTRDELLHMKSVAGNISYTAPQRNNIIEEFQGYFRKKYVKLIWKKGSVLPEMPARIPLSDFPKTQIVKQADVLMLLHVLSDWFDAPVKKKNYEYYLQRTLHKSSLSPSMHALMAIGVKDMVKAYQFFLASVFIDLNDIYGNTQDGMHAACLGGVWQIVVHGFGGVRVHREGILSFQPRLPAGWSSLKFKIKWRSVEFKIAVFEKDIEIYFKSNQIRSIKAIVYQRLKTVYANRVNCFKRKEKKSP